jgi:8-oxo-dGTP pyrophosphatase MutT (NUDIX family)
VSRRGGDQRIPRPTAWTEGGPPPWVAGDPAALTLDHLRERFAARGPGRPTPLVLEGSSDSAVLVALFVDGGEVQVLLTVRGQHLRSHKGEVSFPGGRLDPGETALDAALREATEEVGLDPRHVEIIGTLDDVATVGSRSLIHAFVGVLPERPGELRPNPHEVDRVLLVPLSELMTEGVFREERWGVAPLERSIYFFELADETVWGATARMLVNLLCIAHGVDDATDR